MLEVRRPIPNFRLVVLAVLSNTTLSGVHRNSWIIQILSKESLELNLRQKSHFSALTCAFMPTKADLITNEQSCKQDTVGDYGAGNINMILVLLEGILGGLWFQDNWFEPEGMNPCRTLSLFLSILGGSWSGDWTSRIAWCKFLYLKESLRTSWSLYSAEHGGAFL